MYLYGNHVNTERTNGSGTDALRNHRAAGTGDISRHFHGRILPPGSKAPQLLPDGRVFQYQPKTVAKWYQLYEKGGMEALVPRTRSDKGSTRVIPDEAEREIFRLKKSIPG